MRRPARSRPVSNLSVLDDGSGMDAKTLRRALQFGGSMRFDDRTGFGRFGMGLPNASVSQARHVEVFTWRAPNLCLVSNLDVDDIAAGHVEEIPTSGAVRCPSGFRIIGAFSGTLVSWSKCDRLDNRRISTIVRKLQSRSAGCSGISSGKGSGSGSMANRWPVIDPLFLHKSTPLNGATPFGEPLTFEMRVPGQPGKTSMVRVRFSELPGGEMA